MHFVLCKSRQVCKNTLKISEAYKRFLRFLLFLSLKRKQSTHYPLCIMQDMLMNYFMYIDHIFNLHKSFYEMSCYEFLLLCFWAELHSSLCVKLKPILQSLCWIVVWFNPFCNLTHNVQVSKAVVYFWTFAYAKEAIETGSDVLCRVQEHQIKVSHSLIISEKDHIPGIYHSLSKK